jgi:2-polyprenyl-3-methyl-5-hydroxy-6-metoxy-1,4-benzoquinol methylase
MAASFVRDNFGKCKFVDIRKQMNNIYRDVPLDNIPWNSMEPPALLVEAVESGKIPPCRVVDLGCGAGNYAVWLADRGFDVTGIDISEEAIRHARSLAVSKRVSCRFVAANLFGDLKEFHSSFDFAYDWEVLHHIFPEDRDTYLRNVHSMLDSGGIYFSLCFSEKDPEFGGDGKYRKTQLGTILYFSSEEELTKLYSPWFLILELKTIKVPGKYNPHLANIAWLKKK